MVILDNLQDYKNELKLNEDTENTIKQYEGYILEFINWANIKDKDDITKQKLIDFKSYLRDSYKVNTVNIKILVINQFTQFIGLDSSYKLEQLKVQQKSTVENVLSPVDYERLLRIADKRGKVRTKYIMMTLAETGIRISELQYITVESVKRGVAVFDSKGTVERKAFINKKLKKELLQYCKNNNITTGMLFCSRNGNPLNEAYVYKEIQYVSGQARVNKKKAHPHSFRHLFAQKYLAVPEHNLVDLKNLLGHKNISTTEIYLKKNEKQLKQTLEV